MRDLREPVPRDYRHVGHAVLVACSLVGFLVALALALSFGLSTAEPTERMRYHALPVAISQLYHGQKRDYTGHWQIAMEFQSPGNTVNEIISRTTTQVLPPHPKPYLWTADDRGLADFVYGAFTLFGPDVTSLFYFWFALLGLSLTQALIAYWRDPFGLAVIASGMVAIGIMIPVYTHANAGLPVHISESRMFDPLGCIAMLHLLLSIFRPIRSAIWIHAPALVFQAALLGFLLHTRTTLIWILLSVIVVSLAVTLKRLADGTPTRSRLQALAPALLVIAAWAGAVIHQNAVLNSAYLTEIGPRTVWHNVLIGLIQSPIFSKELRITEFSDGVAADIVLRDMAKRSDPRLGPDWTRENIMNSLGGHARFDWVSYESAARSLVLRTLADNPTATLELVFWQKPKRVFEALMCETLRILPACGSHMGLRDFVYPSRRAGLLSAFWLLFAAVIGTGLALAGRSVVPAEPSHSGPLAAAMISALVIALLPSYIFYAGPMQLAGAAFLFAFALYFTVAALVATCLIRFCPADV